MGSSFPSFPASPTAPNPGLITGPTSQSIALSAPPQLPALPSISDNPPASTGITASQSASSQAATMANIGAGNTASVTNPAIPPAPIPPASAVCSFSNLSACLPNFGLSAGRIAAFVLGLIIIAAGLFLLKPSAIALPALAVV